MSIAMLKSASGGPLSTSVNAKTAIPGNLRKLLDFHEWSERKLAGKSSVAQKTINNILNGESSPTVETIDRLAGAFSLSGWELQLPNLVPEVATNHSLERLVNSYTKASPEGRKNIARIADIEAKYGT